MTLGQCVRMGSLMNRAGAGTGASAARLKLYQVPVFTDFSRVAIRVEIELKVLPSTLHRSPHPWFAGLFTGGRRSARRIMPINTPIRNSVTAGTIQ